MQSFYGRFKAVHTYTINRYSVSEDRILRRIKMNITIREGEPKHLEDCKQALLNSELGRKYFANEGNAEKAILEGLEQGTLYVALVDGVCVGFIWYLPKGAFHGFPYIHIVSVNEMHRCKGIGRQLMNFAEELAFADADKIFLVVADFNPAARRFYEKAGYRQVGEIPGLYRAGITEYLMVKRRDEI